MYVIPFFFLHWVWLTLGCFDHRNQCKGLLYTMMYWIIRHIIIKLCLLLRTKQRFKLKVLNNLYVGGKELWSLKVHMWMLPPPPPPFKMHVSKVNKGETKHIQQVLSPPGNLFRCEIAFLSCKWNFKDNVCLFGKCAAIEMQHVLNTFHSSAKILNGFVRDFSSDLLKCFLWNKASLHLMF